MERHVRGAQLFREPEVFEDAALHAFVSANLLVSGAVNEQKLSEQTALRIPVAEQRKRACAGQHYQIKKSGELFVKISNRVIRRHGERPAVANGKFCEHARQSIRFKPGVRVKKKEIISRCGLCSLMACPSLAAPIFRQRL